MKKKFIIFVVMNLFILTGCTEDLYDSYNPFEELKETIEENENKNFTLSSDKGYADEFGIAYYIEGIVTNNTNNSYDYVQISFNAYDEDGNIIGSCWDNINNLEPKGKWKIKAICSGEANDIKSYKLTDFTSW